MTIAISNHKGGTGKTTTAINLGAAFARKNKRVLLMDLDPQGSLTYSLGIENAFDADGEYNLVNILLHRSPAGMHIETSGDLFVVPGGMDYYAQESDLKHFAERNGYDLLRNELKKYADDFDYVIIDCPPALSTFTNLALVACDKVIVPIQADVLSVKGLYQVIDHIEDIRKKFNPGIEILGVLAVIVDERRQLTYEILEYVRDNFNVNVFNNYIRANVKAAEAPSFGKSVVDYCPDSRSAADYIAFSNELLKILEQETIRQ